MAFHRLVAACVVCAATIFLGQVTEADEREGKAVEYNTVFVSAVGVPATQLGESKVEVDGSRFGKWPVKAASWIPRFRACMRVESCMSQLTAQASRTDSMSRH